MYMFGGCWRLDDGLRQGRGGRGEEVRYDIGAPTLGRCLKTAFDSRISHLASWHGAENCFVIKCPGIPVSQLETSLFVVFSKANSFKASSMLFVKYSSQPMYWNTKYQMVVVLYLKRICTVLLT